MAAPSPILGLVRKGCKQSAWTQGTALAKTITLLDRSTKDGLMTTRMRDPAQALPLTVTIRVAPPSEETSIPEIPGVDPSVIKPLAGPDTRKWSCDCGSLQPPCAHVVAAAIMVNEPILPVSLDRANNSPKRPVEVISRPKIRFEMSQNKCALQVKVVVLAASPEVAKCLQDLQMVPGSAKSFDGSEAIRAATKIMAWSEPAGELALSYSYDNEIFELFFRVEGTTRRVDALVAAKAWRDGLPLVPLPGGGWAPLPREFMDKHGATAFELCGAKRRDGKLDTAAYTLLGKFCEAMGFPPPGGQDRIATMIAGFDRIPEAALPFGAKVKLRDYQSAGVNWLSFLKNNKLGAVLADDMGLGKGTSVTTLIPTPSGWRKIGDLKVGDSVFGTDGRATTVTGVFPQGVKKIFKITFTDKRSTHCDAEHLWYVTTALRRHRKQPGAVMSLEQIMEAGLFWKSKTRPHMKGNSNWFVPMVAPVNYPKAKLSMHPYLLGALLANGSFSGNSVTHAGQQEQRVAMQPFLPEGVYFSQYDNEWVCGITDKKSGPGENPVMRLLRDLDLAGKRAWEKHIPAHYLIASIEQREALLQGLCDNDGTVSEDGMNTEYNTTSPQLAQDVVALVRSLGGTARLSTRIPTYTYLGEKLKGRRDHRIRISLPDSICPVSIPFKKDRYFERTKYPPAISMQKIEPAGEAECVCIAVDAPDHLYVTEDYIVTHNTIQTLCAIQGRTLIICPKSIMYNWKDEITKFRPGLKYSIYHGNKRALNTKASVIITTYAVLRLDNEILANEEWDTVVLDEAQAIKNPDSQSTKAANRLKARFRIALSGTPVENRLEELWSILNFTNRGVFGSRSEFNAVYAKPISDGDTAATELLSRKIRPFILRRLKSDVAKDLPPRTDLTMYCELDADERKLYEQIRVATREEIKLARNEGFDTLKALEALLRLRQTACHRALIPGESHVPTSSKVIRLLEALEEAATVGHKALVFSQWTSFLDLIEPHLKKNNIRFARIDGTTTDREKVVKEFQSPRGPSVFLLSLKAASSGLNLTAADHVFMLDPWWNPAVEDQAAARIDRIGQQRPIFVHNLVAKDTVEERIVALQASKRQLATSMLGGADKAVNLTREDLLALLE